MLDLSIIVVSWNAKEFLLKCLRSFEQATSQSMEVIVVDNASSDGSPEAAQKEFSHVRLLRNHTNLGFAKANNLGARQSAGRYLIFANSDVEILPGCLDSMYGYMENHPAIGMLGPKILNPDLTLQPSCRKFPGLWNCLCRSVGLDRIFSGLTFHAHNDVARNVDVLSGCFWMVRRAALPQVGLLDENFFMYAEDIDWCKRFWDAGWEVVYFPAAGVIHYGGASSSHAPARFYLEMQRANWHYWKKHHGWPARSGFLFISLLHHVIRILRSMVLYLLRPSAKQEMKLKIKRSVACVSWLLPVPGMAIKPDCITSDTGGEKCHSGGILFQSSTVPGHNKMLSA